MSNYEQPGELESSQPDPPFDQLHPLAKIVAELIATSQLDPSTIRATGDLSTLPPRLQEFIRKSRQEQEQIINDMMSPPPEAPPSPDTPQ